MLERARAWCATECKVWEVETHKFGSKDILRWVTNQEINSLHVEELLWFYAGDPDFSPRLVELHTGAHCTAEGKIGMAHAAFSFADVQYLVSIGTVQAGVYQINSTSNPPTYSYAVDYIDCMCYSRNYKPTIPTVVEMKYAYLSRDTQDTLFMLSERHESVLKNEHLSKNAKLWLR